MQRQKELTKAERVRRMEEAHQLLLTEKLEQEVGSLKTTQNAQVNLARLGRSVHYQQRLNSNLTTQAKVIAEAKAVETDSRERLVDATRNEKIYQRLKDKQMESYLSELERDQQKETDEVAGNISRHGNSPLKKNPRHE